jgi:hypothetical protein
VVVLAHSAALSARVRVTLRVPPGASVGHVCACYSSALNASAAERPAAEAVAEASTGSASWTPAACGFSVFASRQVATRGCGAAPPPLNAPGTLDCSLAALLRAQGLRGGKATLHAYLAPRGEPTAGDVVRGEMFAA